VQGVPVTYIPWPSQFLRAFVRKRLDKDKLGDLRYREKIHFRSKFTTNISILICPYDDFFSHNCVVDPDPQEFMYFCLIRNS
jgi:hypothetical protein